MKGRVPMTTAPTTYMCPPDLQPVLGQMPRVKHVIYMEENKRPDLEGFPKNIQIHSMHSVEELGVKPTSCKYIQSI